MRNWLLRLLWILPLLGLLGTLRPEPAQACIWNILDRGNPMPPCNLKDQNEIYRVRQANIKVGQKLLVVAGKIREVKREIRGWQRAYETARGYEDQLRGIYGDLAANPIPSMLATYRRTNLAQYVTTGVDANGLPTLQLVDFAAKTDSIWKAFGDTINLRNKYEFYSTQEEKRWGRQLTRTGVMLDRRLQALTDYDARSQEVVDSLSEAGNRLATRYEGRGDVDGVSEAKISTLSAQMNRLRGTAFEVQAHGISARMRALDGAIEKNETLKKRQAVQQSTRKF